MKNFILFITIFLCSLSFAQTKRQAIRDIKIFQKNLNKEYLSPKETPLRGSNFNNFKQHPFFPINLKYRVLADFIKYENTLPFEIPTSSGKTKTYREFAKLHFNIDSTPYTLTVFQNVELSKKEEYKDYLFLPFRDLTNGHETYGGGKYLDLKIPNTNKIIIDFNLSYQPFCAYNATDYNCPIVPTENQLPIKIEAGVRYDDVYFH